MKTREKEIKKNSKERDTQETWNLREKREFLIFKFFVTSNFIRIKTMLSLFKFCVKPWSLRLMVITLKKQHIKQNQVMVELVKEINFQTYRTENVLKPVIGTYSVSSSQINSLDMSMLIRVLKLEVVLSS